jgi:serine/threonine protein kinase
VYAVASDSKTGWAKDSLSVLKGGTVWYEGWEALGLGKGVEESDERARKEAGIYEVLGQHDRILNYLGLEAAVIGGAGTVPKAWAVRLERAPYGSLRDYILNNAANPPRERNRLELVVQFAKGVAHMH